MKLNRVKLAGFRGFADELEIDLDADVLLITGPNGSGKTSLLDSVLWALTGQVDRLGDDQNVVSRYAQFGEARVELSLSDEHGDMVHIVRRYDGKESLLVQHGSSQVSGPAAEAMLLQLLWPEATVAQDPRASLSRSITRAVYLQQDQVSSFLNADDEQTRFDIVSEIIGSGRVSDLVRQLESARRAWTSATNRQREELDRLVRRRNSLRDQLERVTARADDMESLEARWREWLSSVGAGEVFPGRQTRSAEVERQLDRLRFEQRQSEERLSQLDELASLLGDPPPVVADEDISAVREEVERGKERFDNVTYALSASQSEAAAARQRMVAAQQDRESLAALAELAIRHLGDVCPVCTQRYDEDTTRTHLEELLSAAAPSDLDAEAAVREAAAAVREVEEQLVEVESRLKDLQRRRSAWQDWRSSVDAVAQALELEPTPLDIDRIGGLQSEIRQAMGSVAERRRVGEVLLADLAAAAELEQLAEVQSQYDQIEADCRRRGGQVLTRDLAGTDAKTFHDILREVSETLVTAELERMEPLLQRIYASVDPHPSFRAVAFLTDTRRGRGHLWTSLSDSQEDQRIDDPSIVLSSSQMNVLAVVVFLALSLSVPSLPLKTIMLDDPLQSLDDVNLLGLSDLMRRLRLGRQVILTTHDDRLAGLLERKLRPVGDGQRTVVLRVDSWTRSGPSVTARNVQRDSPKLRLATA